MLPLILPGVLSGAAFAFVASFDELVIALFLRKYRKPKPLVEVGTIEIDDPALEKYKDQIEKDLANME